MARRPHIAFGHHKLSFGGGERVMIEQVAALADLPVDISILYMENPDHLDIVPELRDRNPNIRQIRHAPGKWDCALWLARNRPDLSVVCYHRGFFRAQDTLRNWGLRLPMMAVIHEHYEDQRQYHQRFSRSIDAWMIDYDWRDRLQGWFPGARVQVAHPVYPRQTWPAWGEAIRKAARAEMGIPEEALVVGYVGRLDINKEPWSVIRVAEHLQAQTPRPVHVLLAGADMDATRLRLDEATASSPLKDRIHRLGRLQDVSSAYQSLDLFVLASWQEGFFPFSLIEAMEQGVPVLASTVGGIPTVLEAGQGGFFIHKSDDQQPILAAALRRAVEALVPEILDDTRWELQRTAAVQRVKALIEGYDAATPFRQAVLQQLEAR
jgi:glycosyltransferase involved in cell wall biosynthesis